jgi:Domain of unknown function (DUF697)
MKRILTFLAAFVVIVFALVVVRETVGVIALARHFHPVAGQVMLWVLVLVYAICLGVPLFLFLRLPKPLTPPASDTDPAFPAHLAQLRQRLLENPHLRGVPIAPDRPSIETALDVLEKRADEEIRKEASLVFLTTAVSQSGRLDGLFVLVAQTRLIWKVAHIYRQRAGARELLHLYANVATTVFAAESLEDLDLAEVAEPLMAPLLEAAGVGVTVVLAPVATVLADCLLQGTVNALLTFRVGCIAKRYSAGMPLPNPKLVRKAATREAAVMLGGVITELTKKVTKAVWETAFHVVTGKSRSTAGRVTAFLRGGPTRSTLYEALRKMASSRATEPKDVPTSPS